MTKYVDNNGLLYYDGKVKARLNNKVDKVDGSRLMTSEEATKLAGLNNYTLPTASSEVKGGIKVGAGLVMNGDVLSATGGGTAESVDWSHVTNRPTKLTDFSNDLSYNTTYNADTNKIATMSDVTGQGYQTSSDVESAITSKGYQTSGEVENAITGKGYQTETQVKSTVESYGYQTSSQVETAITDKGYQTSTQVESAITEKGYQTSSQVESAITGKGYQTASDVQGIVTGYGYQTASDVSSAISTAISSTYKASGSIAFANLPALNAENLGKVYNITDDFTTNVNFVEGAGKTHKAGSNVAIVKVGEDYKYDVMAGFIDLSGYVQSSDLVAITNDEIDTIVNTSAE